MCCLIGCCLLIVPAPSPPLALFALFQTHVHYGFQNGFSGFGAYCRSKLCNVLHGQELARRVGGEVNVYVVHPGMGASPRCF